jgi:hypothetical protein
MNRKQVSYTKRNQIKVIVKPAPKEGWFARRDVEMYGSPSEKYIILKCGRNIIEIYGGNTDYETGGITQVKVDGKIIFSYDQDSFYTWKKYCKIIQNMKKIRIG